MDTSTMLWGMLFGSVGLGYFLYGKKQQAFVPMACGVGLMAVPYCLSNVPLLIGVAVLLMLVPYFFRQ